MARARSRTPRFDFRGGVATSFSEDILDHTELLRCKNGRLTTYGAVAKRHGSQRVHSTVLASGNPIYGLHVWAPPGAGNQIIASAGSELFHKRPADADFTQVVGNLSVTRRARFATHRIGSTVHLMIADGQIHDWDDAVLTSPVAGAPAGVDVAIYKNRMLAVDTTKTLYWAKIGDATLWAAAAGGGFADVETYSSDGMIGVIVIGSSALLFKNDNISRFTGVDPEEMNIDTQTEGVSPDVGLIATNTLCRVEEIAFFLSDRGPYMATEAGIQELGLKVEDQFDFANREVWEHAFARPNRRRREVWLFLPSGAEVQNLTGWCWNWRTRSWTGPFVFPFGCSAMADWEEPDASEGILIAGYDGWVRDADAEGVGAKDDVLKDGTGGTNLELEVELPPSIEGDPTRLKSFRGRQSVQADLGAVYAAGPPETGGKLVAFWESELGSGEVEIPSKGPDANGNRVRDYPYLLAARGRRPRMGFRESSAEIVQINGVVPSAALGRSGA